MKTLHSAHELDEFIMECRNAASQSDTALRSVFQNYRMEYQSVDRIDPFSDEYRKRQFDIYSLIARKDYSTMNEETVFDTEKAVHKPFPYLTENTTTAGNHFVAIGHLLKSMNLAEKSSIVEFGPGWGNTSLILAQLGYQLTVIDIEARFCELIQKRAKQINVPIEVINDNFFWAEKTERKFDTVVFFESFHHCHDHIRLLKALQNIVSDQGQVIFAAEPILPDFPIPWGIRLDGESLWAIRNAGWMELGYQEDYFRAALKKTGWRGQKYICHDPNWATVWVAKRNTTIQKSFSSISPEIQTQIGKRQPNGITFEGEAGAGLYGPYISLPAGHYRAELSFDPNISLKGDATLDASINYASQILQQKVLSARDLIKNNFKASLEFILKDDVKGFEIRLFCKSGFKGTFTRLDLNEVTHE